MNETKRFKSVDGLVTYLRELHEEGHSNDLSWEEGFICGLCEAGVIDEEEVNIAIERIK